MHRLPLPTSGVANVTAVVDTPAAFAPPGAMRNVVANGVGNRKRLSRRPGLVKVFAERVGRDGNHRPQAIGTISRASAVTAYVLGEETDLVAGRAARSELVDANAWILLPGKVGTLDAVKVYGSGGQAKALPGSALSAQNLAATANFPNSPACAWCGVDAAGTLAAWAYNWADSGRQRTLLVFADPRSGALLGSRVVSADTDSSSDPANVVPGGFCFAEGLLVLARGRTLAGVEVLAVGGRSLPGPAVSIDTASMPACVGVITGLAARGARLVACFQGDASAGVFANPAGTVAAGGNARHYRAGVAALDLGRTAGAWTAAAVHVGGELDPDAPYVEVNTLGVAIDHGTVRLSEWLERFPRGGLPTSIALADDGSIALGMTGSGWGPDATFTPDGQTLSTVAKFTAAGELVWEQDTGSLIGAEQGGKLAGVATQYVCDIPDEDGGNAGTTSHDGPAVRAVSVDSTGIVYAAGRVHSSGACLFCLEAESGRVRWRSVFEEGAAVGAPGHGSPRLGVAVDPTDQQPLAIVYRDDAWDPDTGDEALASLFKVAAADGAIVWHWSATQDDAELRGTCVAAARGQVIVGGPLFTDS
ncbi:MAG TPA: hypothetical protein VFF65_12860 [Phycisphaerales bacterium]|nr:hypothetical protein [Phycisphaerales bacterium]